MTKTEMCLDKRAWQPSPLPGQVVLVTTVDPDGRPAVATKSWISMVSFGPPPVLMFGCNAEHGTARNVQRTGHFVVNVPGQDLAAACWAVGSDTGVRGPDRFASNGLTPIPSVRVTPPRVAECAAHFECELDDVRAWGSEVAIFGKIVSASVDARITLGDAAARYRALAPFFFLESGWLAPLGSPRPANGVAMPPLHVLTILAVSDLERSAAFYEAAFGWPARVREKVYVEFDLPDGRGLGLYRREGFAHNTGQAPEELPPGALAGTELYFHDTALDGAIERLYSAGARLLSERALRDWGDEAAYFADPDGNVLVVARPRK